MTENDTRLADAAKEGDAEALRRGIAAGRDLAVRDEDNWNALDWAAGRGDRDMVLALLDAGADPVVDDGEGRTAFRTAAAAGHRECAEILRTAMRRRGGPGADTTWRPYCKAYLAHQLSAFDGWPADLDSPPGPDDILYVHSDLTVSRGIWVGEDVVPVEVTPQWERFCREELGFSVPDDLDLMP